MFANVAVVLSTLAIFTAAAPGAPSGGVSQCNTGTLQCCTQVFAPDSKEAGDHADLLADIDLTNVIGSIGFQCNPITVLKLAGGSGCSQAPVCCQGNQLNGAINIGCIAA